ncbi:MAG: SIR2 family protein [Fibrobacter sp.]|nr:SIR2 family protein [Fibrobacter sp.]
MSDFFQKAPGVYRRIFVLGSGFSKSFCPAMPTLRDLNELIPFGIPDEFPHFRDYCRNFLDICNGQREYLNIETLATSILSAQIFPGERERLYHSSLRFEMLRFIASTIRNNEQAGGSALDSDAAAVLNKFLAGCVNSPSDGVRDTLLLSFNYDTIIENAIAADPELSSRAVVDYGVRIDPADRSAVRSRGDRTIDLIKLHGSLNWFPLKGVSDTLDLRNVCQVEPCDRSFPIYCEDTPIYIPMAHAKESFLRGSLFNLLWSKADYYLKNAEEIYFVGYGFPKSDINNLEFLLRHRERFKKVVVFEPSDHPDLMRLQNLLGPSLVCCQDAKDFLAAL